MTRGDIVSVHSSVSNNTYLSVQPSGTIEWGIQNFYADEATSWQLFRTDGTNEILIRNVTGVLQLPQPFNATNSIYFRMKNVSGSAAYMGYDGKISKE